MVPVLNSDGAVVGVVTEGNMTSRLLTGRANPDDSVETAGVIYKTFHKFSMNDTLERLATALDHDPYALIVTEQRCFSGPTKRRKLSNDLATCGAEEDDSTITAASSNTVTTSRSLVATRCVVSGIVTRIDLLDFVSKGE